MVFISAGFQSIALATENNEKVVRWGILHQYPWFITEGERAGQGLLDDVIDKIAAEMPGYRHEKVILSLPRLIHEMKSGHSFCFPALERSEVRDTFITYTPISYYAVSNGLVLLRENHDRIAPYLNEAGEIDLRAFLLNTDFSVSVLKYRPLSTTLNETLQALEAARPDNLRVVTGLARHELTVKQVLLGRLDGVIGRPTEFFAYAYDIGEADALMFVPIQGEERFVEIFAGCTKETTSDQVMSDLSDAVVRARAKEGYFDSLIEWIPTEMRGIYEEMKAIADKTFKCGAADTQKC